MPLRPSGTPEDSFESERIEWIALADIRTLIGSGQITSGTTLAALLYVLAEAGTAAAG